MSIKIKFIVQGGDTPLPPETNLPTPLKIGDKVRYLNSDRHVAFKVTDTLYEIYNSDIYQEVSLEEIG